MDTDKETKEPYKPNFMHHFNKPEDQHKKQNKKQPPVGPQSIYAYFPRIPEGTDFKDYVSVCAFIFWIYVCVVTVERFESSRIRRPHGFLGQKDG